MQISENSAVSIDYVLTDSAGEELDRSGEGSPLAYLQGANTIIPGLERALAGKTAGESLRVEVAPADGYGEYNDDLVQVVSLEMFEDADAIKPGMRFESRSPKSATLA